MPREKGIGWRIAPRCGVLLPFFIILLAAMGSAQSQPPPTQPPAGGFLEDEEIPLEDLLEVTVTSVAKSEQKIGRTAAAIYVLDAEEIRRAGVESLAEAIRLVPGFQVAQIDRSRWAVTARGLGGEFANKLLVMQDGRTLYSPLFSGTYWDVQDGIFADLDRIELIRGPGGTIWGANAVNGVVNILTKHTEDTHGWLVEGGWGTEDNGWMQARYGGGDGEGGLNYRVWGKAFSRDGFVFPDDGEDFNDDFGALRAGFRVDWELDGRRKFRFDGGAYLAEADREAEIPLAPGPAFAVRPSDDDLWGGHLLANYEHAFTDESVLSAKIYYDRTRRKGVQQDETRNTVDFDIQHRFGVAPGHEVIYGGGYRIIWDRQRPTPVIDFAERTRTDQIFNLFAQYTWEAVPETLWITTGTKVEHNQFTGFEFQPSFRLAYVPHPRHSIWAAVSRAVRTPSRVERAGSGGSGPIPRSVPLPPGRSFFAGNPDFGSENLLAFEGGWRFAPLDELSLDVSLHYSDYQDLRGFVLQPPLLPPAAPFPQITYRLENALDGATWGGEISVTARPFEWWRLRAGYAHVGTDLEDLNLQFSARNTFTLSSFWDITEDLEANAVFYYQEAARIENLRPRNSIQRLDLQLVWRPEEHVTLTAGVRNLLDDRHQEFTELLVLQASEIERMAYFSVALRF